MRFDADGQTLLNETIRYYHERLLQAPEALAYLHARGIDDQEAIARFQLDFADRTLGLRLPGKINPAGQAIRSRLQALGLLRESGHEHFNGSLVIPIHDAAGNVVEAYGRKINPALRLGTPKHLCLPGPHRGVRFPSLRCLTVEAPWRKRSAYVSSMSAATSLAKDFITTSSLTL